MIKQSYSILLAVCIILSLSACKGNIPSETSPIIESPSESSPAVDLSSGNSADAAWTEGAVDSGLFERHDSLLRMHRQQHAGSRYDRRRCDCSLGDESEQPPVDSVAELCTTCSGRSAVSVCPLSEFFRISPSAAACMHYGSGNCGACRICWWSFDLLPQGNCGKPGQLVLPAQIPAHEPDASRG